MIKRAHCVGIRSIDRVRCVGLFKIVGGDLVDADRPDFKHDAYALIAVQLLLPGPDGHEFIACLADGNRFYQIHILHGAVTSMKLFEFGKDDVEILNKAVLDWFADVA